MSVAVEGEPRLAITLTAARSAAGRRLSGRVGGSRLGRLPQCGVVGVSDLSTVSVVVVGPIHGRVERGWVGLVQPCSAEETCGEIWIRQKVATEGHSVSDSGGEKSLSVVDIHLLVCNHRPAESFLYQRETAVVALDFPDEEKAHSVTAHLICHVTEERRRVAVAHVVLLSTGTQVHSDSRTFPVLGHGADDFVQQPSTILDAAAIRVVPPVGRILKELVDEVTVRGVNLDAIESSSLRTRGTRSEVLDDCCDLPGLERARHNVWTHWTDASNAASWKHRARRNWGFAPMKHGIRDSAHVPELQKDATSGAVYSRSHLRPRFGLFIRPNARSTPVPDALRRDRSRLADDQTR